MDVKETKMKTQDIKNMGLALQQVQETFNDARPGTKQNQKDFDKAAKMAKPKDKVSLKPMPTSLAKKMAKDEALKGDQHKLDHDDDGDIDAADFKKLRNKKKGEKSEVKPRQETDTDKGQAAAENRLRKEAFDDDDREDRPHTHALVDKKGNAHGFAPYKLRDVHVVKDRHGSTVASSDDMGGAKMHQRIHKGTITSTKAVKLKKPMDHADAKKLVGKSIKGHYHEATESTKWPIYARIMEKLSHTAGATAPEEMDSKDSPSAKKMKKDHKPEVNDTEAKGHVDAAEAGRKGPSAKARPNDNMKGDKNVVNPVKGAVTNGSN